MIIFLNEILEYDITNQEPARFKKKSYNSNYRQNTLPIILDDKTERANVVHFYKVCTER